MVFGAELAWSDISKGERMEDTVRSRERITQSRGEMVVCTRQQ